jgi:multimeric flavodoxin WrbA
MVSVANGGLFKRKVGAAVAAVRRAGAIRAFDTMNHLFQHGQMIVVGSSCWNVSIGRDPGQVREDAEAIRTTDPWAKHGLASEKNSWLGGKVWK